MASSSASVNLAEEDEARRRPRRQERPPSPASDDDDEDDDEDDFYEAASSRSEGPSPPPSLPLTAVGKAGAGGGGGGGGEASSTRAIQLEALVEKRTLNLDYIRRAHQGGCCWFNTVRLSGERIRAYVEDEVPKPRALLFFRLGLSLAKFIDQRPQQQQPPATSSRPSSSSSLPPADTVALLRALAQLFEELEYHLANGAVQSMKLLLAKAVDLPFPELCGPDGPEEPLNPRMKRFGSEVAFEAFYPVSAPFPLDYVQVLDALCHVLSRLYHALGHGHHHGEAIVAHPALFEAVARIDAKVKHHVINPIAKELTDLATRGAKAELDWLRQNFHAQGI